ncbi:MAG TPA: flippase [Patescibacteria group bacterium]|nr:flippase [Patescibacteria group bacterium]
MQQIGRNILSLLFSRVIAGIILFLIYTRLIQYFGPNVAGQYGLIVAFLTVFNFFVDLGMQQLVIKRVSENRNEAGKYLANYFGIQFLLGLGFMLLMDAIVLFSNYPPIVKHSLYVTALSLLVTSLSMPFMSIINAFQRLGIVAKINFANSVINAGMMGLTIFFHKDIFFLSFVNLIVGAFDFIVYWRIVEKGFARFRLHFDFPFWKTLFALNLPFTLLTFFSIYNRIDTLILPHLRSFTENGYYTAVYKFWDTLAFLPAVVSASLYPFFADSMTKGLLADVKRGLEAYTRYMVALALPLTFGAYVLSDRLTVAFFGPAFAPASRALWVLVAAVSVLFIYSPVNALIISQKTRAAVIITGCNLFFNLILNLILIPRYGFVAAAFMTLASECVQWIGYTYVVHRRVMAFKFVGNFVRPAIAALVMAFAVKLLIHQNLWLLIGAGGIIYLALLAAMKFFRAEDKQLLLGGLRINPAPVERDIL